MNTKHSTAPAVDKIRPTTREVVALRFEAILLGAAAAGIVVGASWLAVEYQEPRILLAAGASVVLGVRSWLLWSEVSTGPSIARRVWRRYVAWRMVRAMRPRVVPAPYRRVKVGDTGDVFIPRQPGEMRTAAEPKVPGLRYTASDVYLIVCRASTMGLSERAWSFGDNGFELPSGERLCRDGFREVQTWLVARNFATSKPAYRLLAGVTPEHVLEALQP